MTSRTVMMEQRARPNGSIDWKRKNMVNNKMLSSVLKFDGGADKWAGWGVNVSMVVASENTNFYTLSEFLRDHDREVTDQDVEAFGVNEGIDQEELEWLCDALYMALSARTTSTPLSVVEGLRGDTGFARGARAWRRTFAELNGKTAQRASKLCLRARHRNVWTRSGN